ncbi:hypothetical protein J7M23_01120, partial [Candidatus Sumerlaeota bacterium]|nr:hypothetical protein [Candidatus Sumerlaeota bacterium]
MKKKMVFLIPHSHSDLSWGGTFSQCEVMNMEALDSAVEYMRRKRKFRFTCEHVYAVKRYLELMPEEKKRAIIRQIKSGRMEISALYHGTEENFPGPEALARNFLFGKKWLKQTLGVDSRVAWSMDTPGHTTQMPQLLKKAGVDFYVISGGAEGQRLFHWRSPDGTSVAVFSMGGYCWSLWLGFRENLKTIREKFPKWLEQLKDREIVLIDDGCDWSKVEKVLERTVNAWNRKGEPEVKIVTTMEFKEAIKEHIPGAPEYEGEMPTSWVFTPTGVPETYYYIRYGEHGLRAVESLLVFTQRFTERSYDYFSELLSRAWERLVLRVEHNWFGLNTQITEQERKDELSLSYRVSQDLLAYATEEICERIRFREEKARPIVVFNPTFYPRSDYVEVKVDNLRQIISPEVSEADMYVFHLYDNEGNLLEMETLREIRREDGQLRGLKIGFMAENVPSLGYRTYYLKWGKRWAREMAVSTDATSIQNEYYTLRFAPSGQILSIYDRKDGLEMVKNGFLESYALEDRNVDLEEWLTGMRDNEELKGVSIKGSIVRGEAIIRSFIPEVAEIEKRLTLYRRTDFIDIELRIDWLGKDYTQLRTAFPFALEGEYYYETPFCRVKYPDKLPIWMPYGQPWEGAEIWECFRWPELKSLTQKRQVQNWVMLAGKKANLLLITSHPVYQF